VETTEAVAPVLFTRSANCAGIPAARDSFAAGWGTHIEIGVVLDQDLLLFLSVERLLNPARGRHGGLDGAPGRVRIGHAGRDLHGKGEIRVKAGETLVFETPGGGGFGPPGNRAPQALRRDVEDGLVSETAASTLYGGPP
jgi:N-methylhydantoinase B